MNVRRLALTAVFATMLAIGGCTSPGEDAKPEDPPQAPPPRAKGEKTKADLLVGKWKLVKHNATLADGYQQTVEYSPDGKLTIWIDNPAKRAKERRGNPRTESGTYRVEGTKLILTLIGPADTSESTVTIDSIAADKLVTTHLSPGAGEGERLFFEFERVPMKL